VYILYYIWLKSFQFRTLLNLKNKLSIKMCCKINIVISLTYSFQGICSMQFAIIASLPAVIVSSIFWRLETLGHYLIIEKWSCFPSTYLILFFLKFITLNKHKKWSNFNIKSICNSTFSHFCFTNLTNQ